jgi:hypothetical protein
MYGGGGGAFSCGTDKIIFLSREYLMILEDQAFLQSQDSAHRPPHSTPSPVSKLSLSFSVFLCVIGRAYWYEWGGDWLGEEHTTTRKPGSL